MTGIKGLSLYRFVDYLGVKRVHDTVYFSFQAKNVMFSTLSKCT